MNIAGGSFKLSWVAPNPADQVDHVTIYEHVGSNYNIIQVEAQPNNVTTLTGVAPGVHNYVVKAHNIAGDAANYSNEISVTVLAFPATLVLSFDIS